MTERENLLRTIRFEGPEWIPMKVYITGSCWNYYGQEALLDLMETHPVLFPGFERPKGPTKRDVKPWQDSAQPYRDPWGCVWETTEDGITGSVTEHPLAGWGDFDGYLPPDPALTKGRLPVGSQDWADEGERIRQQKDEGVFTLGGLPHGHTFLRLFFLRGYENLILDMADEDPRLNELIGLIESFNLYLVRRYVEMGVDQINYPEDLGMQSGPMLSPAQFRSYITPAYNRIMAPAREAGCLIHMHSDGDVRELADDLLGLGIHSLNIQDLVNGIDWIREHLKGRVCVDLDIDRQNVVRCGSPKDVKELIREEVAKLSAPEGGFMIKADIYPGTPLENVRALLDALEAHRTSL